MFAAGVRGDSHRDRCVGAANGEDLLLAGEVFGAGAQERVERTSQKDVVGRVANDVDLEVDRYAPWDGYGDIAHEAQNRVGRTVRGDGT